MKDKVFIVLFCFLIIYSFSIGPDPILGDSLAFTVVATKGFDLATNATNHFLYINLLAILHKILPFINPHFLFVSFDIFCSLLTLYSLRKLLLLLGNKDATTILVICIFGFSFTFWRSTIMTEVYSFYLLFVTLFLKQAFQYRIEKKPYDFYWTTLLFGILFLIHIQTILLVPLYLYFLIENCKSDKMKLLAGFLIPTFLFSVLLIPVIQGKHSFIAIFTDNAWGNSFFHFEFKSFLKSLGRNSFFLIYNFLFFLYFILKGFSRSNYKIYISLAVIPYLFFILKHDVSDSYVFQLVPYLFLLIVIAQGIDQVEFRKGLVMVILIPVIYLVAVPVVDFTGFGKKINRETGFKGGVHYFFFPALRGNPGIDSFINAYDNNQLENKPTFDLQYKYAKEWVEIKKNYQ